jgi:hypothetical protein
VATKFLFRSPSDEEYLDLPRHVRQEFEEILPSLIRQPFRSGLGYTVAQVQRHPGLWKLILRSLPPRAFRAVYDVDGETVRFLGFGPRPDFYRKLDQKNRVP